MLTYRCTNMCRHCPYRCAPTMPDDWMSPAQTETVFAALARERHLQAIHLAGVGCGHLDLQFNPNGYISKCDL